MLILGLDIESTGIHDDAEIVEVGLILYHVDSRTIVNSYGKILPTKDWTDEAGNVHGISRDFCLQSKMPLIDPFDIIEGHLAKYIVAHNKEFDKRFITKLWPKFNSIPWICTHNDLDHQSKFLKKITSYRLSHLSVDYGIQIGTTHRAVDDAYLACRIASHHDLDNAYKRSILPKFKVELRGDYNENNIGFVKSKYFHFDGFERVWWKIVRKDELKDHLIFVKSNIYNWNITVVKV